MCLIEQHITHWTMVASEMRLHPPGFVSTNCLKNAGSSMSAIATIPMETVCGLDIESLSMFSVKTAEEQLCNLKSGILVRRLLLESLRLVWILRITMFPKEIRHSVYSTCPI